MDNKFVANTIGDNTSLFQQPHKPVMAVNSLDYNHKMDGHPDSDGGLVSGDSRVGHVRHVSGRESETVPSKGNVHDTVLVGHAVLPITSVDGLHQATPVGLLPDAVAQKMIEMENKDVHRSLSGVLATVKPKKGSFQITNVISRKQHELDNVDHANEDADSVGDDFDETNTEDLSSELMDISKTNDIDGDPSSEDTVQSLLIEEQMKGQKLVTNSLPFVEKLREDPGIKTTPSAVLESEIPSNHTPEAKSDDFGVNRFRIVKVSSERFMRGRWSCYDFQDSERTSREKSNEDLGMERGSGNSSAASSVHYIPGVDDPTKNPFATATTTVYPDSSSVIGSTLPSDTMPGHSIVGGAVKNGDYSLKSGHIVAESGADISSSMPQTIPTCISQSVGVVYSSGTQTAPSLPQEYIAQSGSGQIQSSSIPPSVPVSQSITNTVSSASSDPSLEVAAKPIPSQLASSALDFMTSGTGSTVPSSTVSPNDTLHSGDFRLPDTYQLLPASDDQQSIVSVEEDRMSEGGMAKILVSQTHNIAEPLLEMVQSIGQYSANRTEDESGASTVAIDNKIEQAMDLVKSHLMFAVREEVIVLKEQIKELLEKNAQLEYENTVLRASASPETLNQLQQNSTPSGTSSS